MKKYKLSKNDIKPLVNGMGACMASDRITVDGYRINFMYREKPDNTIDSGWRFFSGINENDAYINNPDNISVLEVNTIANYDSSIIPLLNSPTGSAFERIPGVDEWQTVTDFKILE